MRQTTPEWSEYGSRHNSRGPSLGWSSPGLSLSVPPTPLADQPSPSTAIRSDEFSLTPPPGGLDKSFHIPPSEDHQKKLKPDLSIGLGKDGEVNSNTESHPQQSPNCLSPTILESTETQDQTYENTNGACRVITGVSPEALALQERLQRLYFEPHQTTPVTMDQAAAEAEPQQEIDYEDVPLWFLDPFTGTIMQDPVILPRSGLTVDRSTIRGHLSADPSDPFDGLPLRMEDVVSDVDLRERIETYLRGAERE